MGVRRASKGTDSHVCAVTEFTEIRTDDLEHSLMTRFAGQVAAHRDCLAVRDPTISLSYGELDAWANGVAQAALDAGSSGEPVALVLEQGAASVAAILGALKAGSPYVSLDPTDPRISELTERAAARVVLTDSEHLELARRTGGRRRVVVVDETEPELTTPVTSGPDDVAYVFYTSGSTGRPKGVYDSHRNVLHNVLRYTNTLHIAPSDRLSLIQSPAFSGTVSTLFAALLNGASVHPFPLREHGLRPLGRFLLDERVTIYHSVPAIFRSLLRIEPGPFDDIRIVRLEGDRATSYDVELHRLHFPPHSTLVNGLGLTETGLVRQFFVDRGMAVEHGILPVGYAVENMEITLLDDAGDAVAVASHGEIAVSSAYLALGYWRDPELTSTSFEVAEGRRSYRTGDLGRFRPDGCLEYLGRKDGQLKVLGNRVEPSEVESEVLRLPGVADAAVSTREGRRGEGQLVAYVVTAGPGSTTPQAIRDGLAERLPAYMVPSIVEIVSELAVSASGKIDRRALRSEDVEPAPGSDLERIVAGVWADVLENEAVTAQSDFFSLGGDSLAAAEILVSLEDLVGVTLPMSALASSPTVHELAKHIAAHREAPASPLSVLRTDGAGEPLVLVHGNTGNVLHFAELLRIAELHRPIWALEHAGDLVAISDLARGHLHALREARPVGPYFLAGFCFGAIVAHEMACQLAADGEDVRFLGLLGFTPVDFPSVISVAASERWQRTPRPGGSIRQRVRFHLTRARELPAEERTRYLAIRARNLAGRMYGRMARKPEPVELHRVLGLHRPDRFPGQALVILHAEETAEYTADPRREWAGLADDLDVVLLPGRDHAMLEEPGLRELAALLRDRIAAGEEELEVVSGPR
jgi:amino acid adenylation domain-containing protein